METIAIVDPVAPELTAHFDRLAACLRAAGSGGDAGDENTASSFTASSPTAIDEPENGRVSAIEAAFGLTAFERDILLLAAGRAVSPTIAALIPALLRGRVEVTFDLCLSALAEPHLDALAPPRPLRRWQLLHVDDPASFRDAVVSVPERVLHCLLGVDYLDLQVRALLAAEPQPFPLSDSQQQHVRVILDHLVSLDDGRTPIMQIGGDDRAARLEVARRVAADSGTVLLPFDAVRLSAWSGDLDALCRLIERECILLSAYPAVICTDETPAAVRWIVEHLDCPVMLIADQLAGVRPTLRCSVDKPAVPEQRMLWRSALGPLAEQTNGTLDVASGQYRLGAQEIADAAVDVEARVLGGETIPGAVHGACRHVIRRQLADLADRIEPRATWDDLVLPAPHIEVLRQIVAQVRSRSRVLMEWGFARRLSRGLGVSALFTGESGNGKTLAAEVIAGELGLELYRVDLSGVVSKYIGETEKNLKRVFDLAEDSGAVLLFDEADAIFGKRSDVKDSHDRYANIEVSYLLQRMEAYRGLAILTTNQREALDQAFERRLRFIVTFPFPDVSHREEIWRRMFPREAPVGALDFSRLSQLHVTGGVIRNIVVTAAYLAADEGLPIAMAHLARAARTEIGKSERPSGEAQIRSWM